MFSVFKAEHASSTSVLEEEEEEGGGQQASCLVAKQAVEFPQVITRMCTQEQICIHTHMYMLA